MKLCCDGLGTDLTITGREKIGFQWEYQANERMLRDVVCGLPLLSPCYGHVGRLPLPLLVKRCYRYILAVAWLIFTSGRHRRNCGL